MSDKPLSLGTTKVFLNSKKAELNKWTRAHKGKILYAASKLVLDLAFEQDMKNLLFITAKKKMEIDLFPYRIDIKATTATEDKDKLNISISNPHKKHPTYLTFKNNKITHVHFYMILGCFKGKGAGWQLIDVLILRPETLSGIHWSLYGGGKISAKLGKVRQISKQMFWKK